MRILIGDSLFNQRFLAVAARSVGFGEIVGAARTDELFAAAADADVIAFDPSIDRANPELDVVSHLLRSVPHDRLVVVSSRSAELEQAKLNGIAAARKTSILELGPIAEAMAFVRDRLKAQLLADGTTSPVLPLEPHHALRPFGQMSTGPGADASLLAVSGGSTW